MPALAKASAPTPSHIAPLARRSLTEDAAAQLRRAIVSGELAGGAALPEDQLAVRLGVSRLPVREALIELEQEGLVECDARGRSRVRAFTGKDFEEVFSMRCALEVMSARLAARRMTTADARELAAMIREQEAAKRLPELTRLDILFHDRIMQVARHRQLAMCWKNIRSQIEVWVARAHRAQAAIHVPPVQVTVAAHRRLLGALRSGDERRAGEFMERHLSGLREWVPPGPLANDA